MVKKLFRVFLWTLSMYIVTHIFALSLIPIGLFLVILSDKSVPRLKQRFAGIVFWVVGKKLKVSGLENVRQGEQYLIVSNYPSFYAGFALIHTFPEASVVAHTFISRIPFLGPLLKRIGAIFVDPKRARRSKQAIDVGLRSEGKTGNVIIFPEGQRTPDGSIHRFKRGFVYILRQSPLDLLPVTLNGFYQLKPMKRTYLDPDAELEIVIHRPISNHEVSSMTNREVMEKTAGIIGNSYRP